MQAFRFALYMMNCYLRQVWTRGKIENVHQVGSERCNLFISLSLLFSTFRLPRLHFSTCLVSTFRPSYILFTSELFSSLLSDLPTLHFSTLLFSTFRLPYPLLLYFLHFPTFRLPWSSLSTFFTALVFRLPCSSLLYLLPSPLFFTSLLSSSLLPPLRHDFDITEDSLLNPFYHIVWRHIAYSRMVNNRYTNA